MTMNERKPFEFKVGERKFSVKLGEIACIMFRHQQEVDYLAINTTEEGDEESSVLRIFNNVKLVRWLAGFAFHEDGIGLTTAEGRTFHDDFGWNPVAIIKAEPTPAELEWFLDVNARNLESEWEKGLDNES